MPRLGILLSGSGTTYANLADHCADGRVGGEISVVIGSKPGLGGLAKAEARGHATVVAHQPDDVTAALVAHGVDWVVMCGWLKYWDPPEAFRGRTLNIHPSLLPAFGGKGMYGHHVHAAVVAHGCRVSGCTVHLVSGGYDTGRILAQAVVPVLPQDTPDAVAARVQAAERHLYPHVIAALLAGRAPDPAALWVA